MFKLHVGFSLLGLEFEDWLVLMLSWTVVRTVVRMFVPPRLLLVASAAVTGLLIAAYVNLKQAKPRGFFRHLLAFLSEPDVYRVTPDPWNVPCVLPVATADRRPAGRVRVAFQGGARRAAAR